MSKQTTRLSGMKALHSTSSMQEAEAGRLLWIQGHLIYMSTRPGRAPQWDSTVIDKQFYNIINKLRTVFFKPTRSEVKSQHIAWLLQLPFSIQTAQSSKWDCLLVHTTQGCVKGNNAGALGKERKQRAVQVRPGEKNRKKEKTGREETAVLSSETMSWPEMQNMWVWRANCYTEPQNKAKVSPPQNW